MNNFDGEFIQYSKKKSKNETQNLALYLFTHITLYIVLIFFLIFFAWYTVFITTHRFYAVSGVSMEPTLNTQIPEEKFGSDEARKITHDAVYVDRFAKIKVFDVVVIELPGEDSIIKRVVAQGGDYITIAKVGEEYRYFRIPKGTNLEEFSDEQAIVDETGALGYSIYSYAAWSDLADPIEININDQTHTYEEAFYNTFLKEYYMLDENEKAESFYVSASGLLFVKVPEGKFFCMGDNRAFSTDSRKHGFFDQSHMVGRTEFVVYNYNFVNRIVEVVKFYFAEVEKFFAR